MIRYFNSKQMAKKKSPLNQAVRVRDGHYLAKLPDTTDSLGHLISYALDKTGSVCVLKHNRWHTFLTSATHITFIEKVG
jgi:hypothetical protein